MKNLKMVFRVIISLLLGSLTSCQEDTFELEGIKAPKNLTIDYEIVGQDADNPNGDGSGMAVIKANAENAVTYYYIINGTQVQAVGGEIEQKFFIPGVNTYNIEAFAVGSGGTIISSSTTIDILSVFEAPQDIIDILTDGIWRIKSEVGSHFGLGPVDGEIQTEWYGAAPNEKEGTGMYDDRFTFNTDGTFEHFTGGTVFGRDAYMDQIGSGSDDGTTTQGSDVLNYPLESYTGEYYFTEYGDEGVGVLLSGTGFIGYYTGGNHIYEFYQYKDQTTGELILRTTDGNSEFDWWFIITNCEVGEICEETSVDVEYSSLLWEDNFDGTGSPNSSNWVFETGRGQGGWGNQELQYYTDRTDNVFISDGTLKITAKKETFNGALYTSARMKTEGNLDFTYGRVDVRAKLPKGGGTWPAIWMLGSNFPTVGWPTCGEIDIMEHVGNNPNIVQCALHYPNDFGNTQTKNSLSVSNVDAEWHVYSVNWSADEISFLVDDTIYYTYKPDNKDADNWPYDSDQFIILNLAMGGTLGGDIDTAFTEATMEIDYVRVYQ